MNSLRIEVLAEHQLSEDGLSCACKGVFYTVAAPYPETLRQQALHQLHEIAHTVPFQDHHRCGEWDDD